MPAATRHRMARLTSSAVSHALMTLPLRALLLAAGIVILSALAAQNASAHGDADVQRFVAHDGLDQGRCANRFRPCATLGYALRQSNKGDRLLVARGDYAIEDPAQLFYLVSGMVDVFGGYDRLDHYLHQAPDNYVTRLIGVPAAWRQRLATRGFNVIADAKSLTSGNEKLVASLESAWQKTQVSGAASDCAAGVAGGFACDNVNLLSHMALQDFRLAPVSANDIWGFVDLNTGRLYAIIGLRNGLSVVDVTEPAQPFEVGAIAGQSSTWRDIKVYQVYDTVAARWKSFAYVSTDSASEGTLIVDLTALPNRVTTAGRQSDERNAHNVVLYNTDPHTGITLDGRDALLGTAGANLGFGGFRLYRLDDPRVPQFAGDLSGSGYMHDGAPAVIRDARKDTQCINAGQACDVLADYNETSLEIIDISRPQDARRLGSIVYPETGYTHSGAWSDNARFLFLHDELDEQTFGFNTRVRAFDMSDLRTPLLAGVWRGPTAAIDHNGLARGNLYYVSNYTRGLTILDITNPGAMVQAGYFDTYPVSDAASFSGAWGVYPFLPNRIVLVSDINSGLYVLEENLPVSSGGMLQFVNTVSGMREGTEAWVDVSRTGAASGSVSVTYETMGGSAKPGEDYVHSAGTLQWSDGDAGNRRITVPGIADSVAEGTEIFFLRLSSPVGGAMLGGLITASLSVHEPGAAAEPRFSATQLLAPEAAGRVVITVRRDQGSLDSGAVATLHTEADTATGGIDYQEISNEALTWGANDASPRTVVIDIMDDGQEEPAEVFRVRLEPMGTSVEIVIEDGLGQNNVAPVAVAGANQTVIEGSQVVMSGNASFDPDVEPLTYQWSQTGGLAVPLSAAGAIATFDAPIVNPTATLQFSLIVIDATGAASSDEVAVTVVKASTAAASQPTGGGGGAQGVYALLLLLIIYSAALRRRARSR